MGVGAARGVGTSGRTKGLVSDPRVSGDTNVIPMLPVRDVTLTEIHRVPGVRPSQTYHPVNYITLEMINN